MKKKLMCMLLSLTVLTGVIAGCGNTVKEGNVETTDSTEVSVEEQSSKSDNQNKEEGAEKSLCLLMMLPRRQIFKST